VNFCLYIVTEGVQYFIILSSKNFYSFKPSNKLGKIIPTFQKKKCIKKYQKLFDRFGFDERFCNWIREILHSAKLSILDNWKAVGYFNCAHCSRCFVKAIRCLLSFYALRKKFLVVVYLILLLMVIPALWIFVGGCDSFSCASTCPTSAFYYLWQAYLFLSCLSLA
jgi:hypothetical protein